MGIHDDLTGQAVNAFVSIKDGHENTEQLRKELVTQVRKSIGPFAAPKVVFIVPDLPKTRSGKIMRRILRKILSGEEDSLGDTSTVRQEPFSTPTLTERSCRIQPSSTPSSKPCTQARRSSTRSGRKHGAKERVDVWATCTLTRQLAAIVALDTAKLFARISPLRPR